jgi:hypothetical protein
MEAAGEKIVRSVSEAVGGFAGDDAGLQEVGQVAVEGDLSQADDDADAGESFDFAGEVSAAVANLLRGGLVAGRGAADDGGDPGVAKLEAVVAVDGTGLAGEAKLVEDGVHEVAGAVAGEGAAGAVGAVSAGCEAEDENAGERISKAGHGARPVGLVEVGAAFGLSDASAVVAETGAEFAGNDRFVNLLKELQRSLFMGRCHGISMIVVRKLQKFAGDRYEERDGSVECLGRMDTTSQIWFRRKVRGKYGGPFDCVAHKVP